MATAKPKLLYENRLDDATPVASSTADDTDDTNYNVLNLRDWRNGSWWQPLTLPADVLLNSGSLKSANYVVVYGHNMGTKGNTFELRGSTDNFSSSDVSIASKTPANDKPFVIVYSTVNYNDWKFLITGGSAPSLAIVAFGNYLQLPRRFRTPFDPTGRKIVGSTNVAEGGGALGKVIRYEKWARTLKTQNVSWSWLHDTWQPAYEAHLRGTPFIFSWDSSDHPEHLFLVSLVDGYDGPLQPGDNADLSFKVAGSIP